MRTLVVCIVSALVLAGCSSPAEVEPETVASAEMAPGSQANVLLLLDNITGPVQAEVVDADGLAAQAPVLHTGNGAAAGWLHVEAADEPGRHRVLLEVTGSGQPRPIAVLVNVSQADDHVEAGQAAEVRFTLRAPNGSVALTTRGDVVDSPLPKVPGFQPPQQLGPVPLPTGEAGGLPQQIRDALVGAGVGHRATAQVEGLFGPEHRDERLDRQETVDRTLRANRTLEASRAVAEQQGLVDNTTQAGDPVDLGGPFPYVVQRLNETAFVVELDVEPHDRFTLHAPWPNATRVAEMGDEHVVFRTDPPVAVGEPFTWNPDWPGATEITAMNETRITLRHSPSVGTTYDQATAEGVVENEVIRLEADAVVVRSKNPHPLGGASVTMDFTVLATHDGQAAPTPAPRSG